MTVDVKAGPRGLRQAERWLVGGLVASVAVACVAAALVGGGEVLAGLGRLDLGLLAGLLGLSLLNYVTRAARWLLFADRLGLDAIGWREHALYFIAGFAMAVTPGKLGEALRLWLLRRRTGYRYHRTTAMLIGDRLADMVSMLVLCGVGLMAFPGLAWSATLLALLVAAMVVVIAWPGPMLGLIGVAYGRVRRWPRLFAGVRHILRHSRQCLSGPALVPILLLSVIGWLAEAAELWWLMHALGADISPGAALFVFGFATFAGVLTMLPGGLGGVEAGIVGLLALLGVDLPTAIVAAVVLRATTLWFAVLIGFAVLPWAMRRAAEPL
jgi:uncharacterized membrane protein YbhN (UPF0104 family)